MHFTVFCIYLFLYLVCIFQFATQCQCDKIGGSVAIWAMF